MEVNLVWVFSNIVVERIPPQSTYQYIRRLLIEFAYLDKVKALDSIKNVYDIVQLSKMNNPIPYFVRGSANSSILCYLLGISHIDSIKYKVELARFINSTRKDLPDIDIDFPAHLRPEMFRRINEKFRGRVARISNKVNYRKKSAMRQAIRNVGIHKFYGKHEDLLNSVPKEVKRRVIEESRTLVNTFHYYSLHCGGILIFPDKIPSELLIHPKIKDKPRDDIIPQVKYDKYDVDENGLFKIDILSNRAFSTLLHIDSRDLTEYPEEDELTAKQLAESVIGVTLAESSLIGYLCRRYRPKNRYQLTLTLSLARPASQCVRLLKTNDLKKIEEEEDIFIFDDDAIECISEVAGVSKDEADRYRKIFAKNNRKGISQFRQLMIERGWRGKKLEKLVKKLCTLQKYGFCKGHALAFGYLVWGLAYCKAHYPKRFWLATLNHSNTEWRDWVHYRSAIIEGGLSLPLENMHTNWKLVDNKLRKRYSQGKQRRITNFFQTNTGTSSCITIAGTGKEDPRHSFYEYGFWNSKAFMPGMYFHRTVENNKEYIEFRGLIGRIKHGSFSDYITISYDNGKYIDCSISRYIESDLEEDRFNYHDYHVLEGIGSRSLISAKYNKHLTVKWYTMYEL